MFFFFFVFGETLTFSSHELCPVFNFNIMNINVFLRNNCNRQIDTQNYFMRFTMLRNLSSDESILFQGISLFVLNFTDKIKDKPINAPKDVVGLVTNK